MSVDLPASRKHFHKIFGIRQQLDKHNLETDFTSYVNAVARIEIRCYGKTLHNVLNNKYT